MTNAEIKRLADYMGVKERWRIWNICPAPHMPHEWQNLPLTDSGDHYCPNCVTLWSPDGMVLNVPRHPDAPPDE